MICSLAFSFASRSTTVLHHLLLMHNLSLAPPPAPSTPVSLTGSHSYRLHRCCKPFSIDDPFMRLHTVPFALSLSLDSTIGISALAIGYKGDTWDARSFSSSQHFYVYIQHSQKSSAHMSSSSGANTLPDDKSTHSQAPSSQADTLQPTKQESLAATTPSQFLSPPPIRNDLTTLALSEKVHGVTRQVADHINKSHGALQPWSDVCCTASRISLADVTAAKSAATQTAKEGSVKSFFGSVAKSLKNLKAEGGNFTNGDVRRGVEDIFTRAVNEHTEDGKDNTRFTNEVRKQVGRCKEWPRD